MPEGHYGGTANQSGGHSFYAEAVVDNIITNKELAKKVHDVGSISSPAEIKAILEVLATVIQTEAAENNRIQLESGDGGALVSIYPSCTGSVSDKDVLADPEKFGGATVATADMLTPDLLSWTLGATVGIKYSKQFALNKQAQKVKYVATDIVAEEPETPSGGGSNGGGGGGNNGNGELEE